MTYLKVYDNTSKIERQVTQKAFDIINKNKRNPRYKFLEYVDEDGKSLVDQADAPVVETTQKKTEVKEAADPVEVERLDPVGPGASLPEGVTIIRKKPGPKPKKNAQE